MSLKINNFSFQNHQAQVGWKIEIFCEELNSWISLSIKELYSLLCQSQELKSKNQFKISLIPTITIKTESIEENIEKSSPHYKPEKRDFVEFKTSFICTVILDPLKHTLQLDSSEKRRLEGWARGKIISLDLDEEFFLVEYQEKLYKINNSKNIRPISSTNNLNEHINSLYLEIIPNTSPELGKNFLDYLSKLKYNFYYDYYEESAEFLVIATKDQMKFIKAIYDIKFQENEVISKYNNEIKSVKADLVKLNSIKEIKSKEILQFHQEFLPIIKQKLLQLKEVQYLIFNNTEATNDNKLFTLVMYSSDNSNITSFSQLLGLKQDILKSETLLSNEEIEKIANKSKIEKYYYEQTKQLKELYILANDKSINDFKKLWNITIKYSQKIERHKEESESIKKELTTLKRQFNLK